DVEEARNCLEGGADIIDVKNPREGSLGANFPAVIRAVRKEIGAHPLSAALGDIMFKPGTIALAAHGLAYCGVDYVKV
ncbi:MAG: (5-formylfuran-3-yl)methyl phosphate synthase, partial [Candidatus Hodarchaeota archaeon]